MNNRPSIAIVTLGCKVNQYDTDAMLRVFQDAGLSVSEGLVPADIYILNTCAVTQEAEKKSRQCITRIRKVNENAYIFVCGCASQNNFTQFSKDGVHHIIGTDGKVALAKQMAKDIQTGVYTYTKLIDDESFSISNEYEDNDGVCNLKTRHFIKVQDGCNNFCSYCLIPYLRGRSRSRSLESIKREIDEVKGNIKEIIVTGINLSAYGTDINSSLEELLITLSKYTMRVRLGSLEVRVITESLLKATMKIKNFCPHFHLSLQSGSNKVLKEMNRHYTADEYYKAVRLIREYYPDAAITTDIIVGFPTETEEDFINSVEFAKKVAFADIHVFPYSSRKGTVAGKLKVLSPEIVEKRAKIMAEVKTELIHNYLSKQIGIPCRVLFETEENGVWVGHTPNYIKVYSEKGEHNTIRTITPSKFYEDGLI